MVDGRFGRQELLFGAEGQAEIERRRVAIVGVGGLGSHVAQQLAYLGTRSLVLIDGDRVTTSNLNRLIGAIGSDTAGNELKVDVAERMVKSISPEADVVKVTESFISPDGFDNLKRSDFVFGCVDNDASRLILNELCQAYERPYLDIATDILTDQAAFGGRLVFANGQVCLSCKGELDQDEIRYALSSENERAEEERIYGIRRTALGNVGPAVVSLNGIMASVAVTEFMVEVTAIRPAYHHLEYRGAMGILTHDRDLPDFDCYFCCAVRGKASEATVEHYISEGLGERILAYQNPGAN